jgi:hypothetical protein
MAGDGPRCTNMYETRNETANLVCCLAVAALGRPLADCAVSSALTLLRSDRPARCFGKIAILAVA